jgi:2-oxoisovalerate dehydrogenase E1 component
VKKTRKILLASDACERGSYLHTMASKINQMAFDELDAPPVVVGARNWITPPDEVEDAFFPYPSDIIDAVHEHNPTSFQAGPRPLCPGVCLWNAY